VRLARNPNHRVLAGGARSRKFELRTGARSLGHDDLNHVRDDVARALDEDGVAHADVLAPDLVLVVEADVANRDAVTLRIVTPASSTGSSLATGVSVPVLPTWTSMDCTTVVAWRAANLKAIAHRG